MAESAVNSVESAESVEVRLEQILANVGFNPASKSPRQYFILNKVKEHAEEMKDRELVEACLEKMRSMREVVSQKMFSASLAC